MRHFSGTAPFFVGLVDNLVVHVGNVLYESHVEAAPLQVAAHHVKHDKGARVANMDIVVHGWPAHIHANLAQFLGLEIFLSARARVVNSDHRFVFPGLLNAFGLFKYSLAVPSVSSPA